jgi:hypothetical protein
MILIAVRLLIPLSAAIARGLKVQKLRSENSVPIQFESYRDFGVSLESTATLNRPTSGKTVGWCTKSSDLHGMIRVLWAWRWWWSLVTVLICSPLGLSHRSFHDPPATAEFGRTAISYRTECGCRDGQCKRVFVVLNEFIRFHSSFRKSGAESGRAVLNICQ